MLFGLVAILAWLFKIDLARGYVLIAFPLGTTVPVLGSLGQLHALLAESGADTVVITSSDGLPPQLLNVFAGKMSLVGPRPPLEREVAVYEDHVHRRFLVKPGITGLWQINGRSNLSWEESVRLDLYYVENWSLAGDLVILWRTARAVLARDGAY